MRYKVRILVILSNGRITANGAAWGLAELPAVRASKLIRKFCRALRVAVDRAAELEREEEEIRRKQGKLWQDDATGFWNMSPDINFRDFLDTFKYVSVGQVIIYPDGHFEFPALFERRIASIAPTTRKALAWAFEKFAFEFRRDPAKLPRRRRK